MREGLLKAVADFCHRNYGVRRSEVYRAFDEGHIRAHDGLVVIDWELSRKFRRKDRGG